MVTQAAPMIRFYTSRAAYDAGDNPILDFNLDSDMTSLGGNVVPNGAFYEVTGLFSGERVDVFCAAIPNERQLATWDLAPVGHEGDVLTLVDGAWLPQALPPSGGGSADTQALLNEIERGFATRAG